MTRLFSTFEPQVQSVEPEMDIWFQREQIPGVMNTIFCKKIRDQILESEVAENRHSGDSVLCLDERYGWGQ